MIEYDWWGGKNSPPPHLKTRKQLSELGLVPKQPVGIIKTRKYDVLLYDSEDLMGSVKKKRELTDKQKYSFKLRRVRNELKFAVRLVLSRYKDLLDLRNQVLEITSKPFLILDIETTGLIDGEIIEIAVIDNNRGVRFNALLKPSKSLPDNIHGITDKIVANAPTFKDVHSDLSSLLLNKQVLIYNASFVDVTLREECIRNDLPIFKYKSTCLMLMWAIYVGEWSERYGSYKWQSLNGENRALSDVLMAYDKLKNMTEIETDFYFYVREELDWLLGNFEDVEDLKAIASEEFVRNYLEEKGLK